MRDVILVLAATLSETVPLPEPEAPAPIVAQVRLSDVLQLHPVGAVTATGKVPPPDVIVLLAVGLIAKVQGAPPWFTV